MLYFLAYNTLKWIKVVWYVLTSGHARERKRERERERGRVRERERERERVKGEVKNEIILLIIRPNIFFFLLWDKRMHYSTYPERKNHAFSYPYSTFHSFLCHDTSSFIFFYVNQSTPDNLPVPILACKFTSHTVVPKECAFYLLDEIQDIVFFVLFCLFVFFFFKLNCQCWCMFSHCVWSTLVDSLFLALAQVGGVHSCHSETC